MKLKQFLRKKQIYRLFKRRWIEDYKAKHINEAKRLSKFEMNKLFKDWLETWSDDDRAIYFAFCWPKKEEKFWIKINEEWWEYLYSLKEYGKDIID